jgi:glucose-6-phosphate dehydrogenase assembly protein OpcA
MSEAAVEGWHGVDVTITEVERELAQLRSVEEGQAYLRTSVLTHIAWMPPEWEQTAFDTLSGLAERHPSRAILLLPVVDAEDGIDADVTMRYFTWPGLDRDVCSEVITLRLRGRRAQAPASIVTPLLIADLPVFLRWRGRPPFGQEPFEQLIDVVDRLIIDSTEWPDLPQAYAELVPVFSRAVVSDIAWARTSRWRPLLASLWPGIADVSRIRVRGTTAQAHLIAGWLRSRLDREIALEHGPADRLEGVELDGEPAPFPPGDPPNPSDLLSDELERYSRDPIYEAAVTAAGAAA